MNVSILKYYIYFFFFKEAKFQEKRGFWSFTPIILYFLTYQLGIKCSSDEDRLLF